MIFTLGFLLIGCGVENPVTPDGEYALHLCVIDTSGVDQPGWIPVPGANVNILSSSFYYKETFVTDNDGLVVIENLPAGDYTITAEKKDDVNNFLVVGQLQKRLEKRASRIDTVFTSYIKASPLVINEVYYCGCSRSSYYFYDQFIELYNSSQDTIFLDGYVICRSTHFVDIDEIENVDYALAYYIYGFPGTRGETRNCPIAPAEFLVIAGDAINHSIYFENSVDLSNADWEFCNPLKNDYDNLTVPNLSPLSEAGKDFLMHLAHEAIWLATGEDFEYVGHFDGYNVKTYVHIPLWTMIDGIEYSSNAESQKILTVRIDAGLGANGMTKYSGQSIERRYPGLDSNNSSFDFEISTSPTPGRQH